MSLNSNTTGLEEILASVNALPEAGGGTPTLQEKTVTPTLSEQTVTYDAGYDGLSKVTVNAMPTATQATPSISVSSGGLITAKTTQTAGYVIAGTKSATKQLTIQAETTITPGYSQRLAVPAGYYTTGEITVAGDTNLVAGNIKSGVSIFGVAGSYEGSGGGSVETCTVTLTSTSGGSYRSYFFTSYVDGEFIGNHNLGNPPIVIENVICGAPFTITGSYAISGYRVTNATLKSIPSGVFGSGIRTFKLIAEARSNVTIDLYNAD